MSPDLVEKIIGDILAGGVAPKTAVPFPRPNYQRDKPRREPSQSVAYGDFVDQVVAKALGTVPTAALLGFSETNAAVPQHDAAFPAIPPVGGGDGPLVGTIGAVSGFVVPDCPRPLLDYLGLPPQERAVGLLHARGCAVILVVAADTVFDGATSPAISPRFGQGNQEGDVTLVFGTQETPQAMSLVSQCLHAVEERQKEILSGDLGRIEAVYASPVGSLLHRIYKVPLGSTCGVVGGYPFPLGLLAASAALGQSGVSSDGFSSLGGLCALISGTPRMVKEALQAARNQGAILVGAGVRS